MQLIASGDYCSQEFSSEFGVMPPSFLPVGNCRLFEKQVHVFDSDDLIYLSLPECFEIELSDSKKLQELGVEIIRVPEGLSIGESISYCINVTCEHGNIIEVSYGDTLIEAVDTYQKDLVAVAEIDDNYDWHLVDQKWGSGEGKAIAGFFRFSNSSELVKAITHSSGDFIAALYIYSSEYKQLETYESNVWLDFGHVHTYFRSKATITTQRVFNEMEITTTYVEKKSFKSGKIKAEIQWYNSIPASITQYTPRLLSEFSNNDLCGYRLEYLYLSSLSELCVFGSLPVFVWDKIFSACEEFLDDCRALPAKDFNRQVVMQMYTEKTKIRMLEYLQCNELDVNAPWVINGEVFPTLNELINITDKLISVSDGSGVSLIHGDFCFSNILYDFRTQRVKVIDPRGVDVNGECTIYGDRRYDVAKLTHSMLGSYDYIVAGKYFMEQHSPTNFSFNILDSRSESARLSFMKKKFAGVDVASKENIAITIQLFISMLPLHNDCVDRQKAFLCNSFRLYKMLEEL